MTSRENTGSTVPAWILERAESLEAAWPPQVLAAGTALVILAEAVLGVIWWTADGPVYYAHP